MTSIFHTCFHDLQTTIPDSVVCRVLDLALILGVTKFGLQGMLRGPLLVAVLGVVWSELVATMEKQDEDELSPKRSGHIHRR